MHGAMTLLASSLTQFQIWSFSHRITFLEFVKGAAKRFCSDPFLGKKKKVISLETG